MITVPNNQKTITLNIENEGTVDLVFSVSGSGGYRLILERLEEIVRLYGKIGGLAEDAAATDMERGARFLMYLAAVADEYQGLAKDVFGESQYAEKLASIADSLPLETWGEIAAEISKGYAEYVKESMSTEGKRE